jgi:hypothetical protein
MQVSEGCIRALEGIFISDFVYLVSLELIELTLVYFCFRIFLHNLYSDLSVYMHYDYKALSSFIPKEFPMIYKYTYRDILIC